MLAQAVELFRDGFEKLNAAEKRDFLQLLIHQVRVYPGRVDVELYDGVTATRSSKCSAGSASMTPQ